MHDPSAAGISPTQDDGPDPLSVPAMKPSAAPAINRRWLIVAKATVTVMLLALVLSRVDLARCVEVVGESIGLWLVAAFVSNVLALIISTYKWDILLRAKGVFTRRWKLLKIYTVGFFMNSCLPGVVGGDVIRCQLAAGGGGSRMTVAATILAERIIGVVALVLMCLCAILCQPVRLATPPILWLLGASTFVLVAALIVGLNRRLATGCMYRMRRSSVRRAARLLYRLHRTLRTFQRGHLLVALLYSFFFYLGCGVTLYLVCRAFSAHASLFDVTTVLIFVCLLTLIPISLGGLGLRQAGDVYMFGVLGIGPEDALGISLISQLINYGYVLIGGIILLTWRDPSRKKVG